MPFIPHTEEDIADMLASIGAKTIEELFDEIPKELISGQLTGVPYALDDGACRQGWNLPKLHWSWGL